MSNKLSQADQLEKYRASVTERFWRYTVKGDGCWSWTGCVTDDGRGLLGAGNRQFAAPRISWWLHFGPVPEGLQVTLLCENTNCVRPDHMAVAKTNRGGSKDRVPAFWAKVDKSGECWVWTGWKNERGYGCATIYKGTRIAHRVSWLLTVGDIPPGHYVCHRCDNPACVRPDHLFLGDALTNMQDMAAKGRAGWQKDPETHAARSRRQLVKANAVRLARRRLSSRPATEGKGDD